jgi:prophage tail gpP-like protein
MADDVTLKVGGQLFEGWTDVQVSRTLDTPLGWFSLGFTERFPGHPERWLIQAGAEVVVSIGADLVLTGYVDTAEPFIGPSSHQIVVSGRDKTCDLVDCSVIHKPGSWTSRKLEQIASEVAKPFGVTVRALVGTGATFGRAALQQGERAFDLIERLAKERALIAVSNEAGELELRRPGKVKAGYRLVLGENIETIRFRNDVTDRYSQVTLKGHAITTPGEFLLDQVATTSQPTATAKDPGVTRYRPLLIVNADQTSGASLGDRARWEVTRRKGRAQTVTVEVADWRADGELFRVDRLVPVQAAMVGVDAELLVVGVTFTRSATRGKRTTLTLCPPEAYALVELPAKRTRKKKGKGIDPLLTLQ